MNRTPLRNSLKAGLALATFGALASGCRSLAQNRVNSVASPYAVAELDVPFITSPDSVVAAILTIAQVSDKDFVLDLGSGDGRIPITAAKRYGARGLGVEIDPALVTLSQSNAKAAKVDQLVDFKVQDLFETDLSQASVITMYLLPEVNLKLKPALRKLKKGTRIVSHDWDMGDWLPDRTEIVSVPDKKVGLEKKSKIMLWVIR
jgi:SAM-dependent methyltransferase